MLLCRKLGTPPVPASSRNDYVSFTRSTFHLSPFSPFSPFHFFHLFTFFFVPPFFTFSPFTIVNRATTISRYENATCYLYVKNMNRSIRASSRGDYVSFTRFTFHRFHTSIAERIYAFLVQGMCNTRWNPKCCIQTVRAPYTAQT